MHFISKMKLASLKKAVALHYQQREEGKNVNKRDEINANMALAKFYDKHLYNKSVPQAEIYALETYRAAAMLGDAEAQYIVADRLIAKGRFWQEWTQTHPYASDIHQRYAKAYYDEGFSYLHKAEEVDFPLALRLHGLALLRGWGIEKKSDQGIKLIVESIEKEGKWDKAADIVKQLGLDPQKFFSSWTAIQKNK